MQSGCGNRNARHALWRLLLAAIVPLAMLLGAPYNFSNPPQSSPDAKDLELDDILARMDNAAEAFTSMVGDLEHTKVTVIVNDHSTEKGRIFFEKSGGKTRVLIALREPAEKYVLFAEGKVSFYQPKIAEVDEYLLSQKQDLVEQFLLLGFGTPGAELQKNYRLALRGEEKVAGQQAIRLELIPKSPKVAAQLQRIELWISPENWQPVGQKFFEPGGDYFTALYSNIKWNQKIPAKNFRLPLKGKVRVVRPQSP